MKWFKRNAVPISGFISGSLVALLGIGWRGFLAVIATQALTIFAVHMEQEVKDEVR